jgi:hypothetical protein
MMSESWADSGGHLWLFAGWNTDTYAESYLEDDQWVFDPSSNEWTLMVAGNNQPEYGTLGIPSPGSFPTTCAVCPNWTDKNGNFWLYGGLENAGDFTPPGNARDLWWFSPSTNVWTWMGGTQTQQGIYGTLGVPGLGDSPSARGWAVTWTGKDGNLWVFGGGGYDANDAPGAILNDLWVYGLAGPPSATPHKTTAMPNFSLAAGTYGSVQSVTLSDVTPGATIYYTTDGSAASSYSSTYSSPISVTSSETIEAVATAGGYVNSAPVSATYVLNLPPAATPTFNVPGGTYQTAQTVSLSDATAGATIYYTRNGITPTTSSTVYSGSITVSASEVIEAIAAANGYSASAVASAAYTINLPPPTFSFGSSPSSLTVKSGSQGSVTLTVTPQNGFNSTVSFACSGLPSGASCSFSPSTVAPSGAAATTQLTISASTQAANQRRDSRTFIPTAALALSLCLIGWKKRRRYLQIILLVATFAVPGLISSCGGGGGTGSGGGGGGGTQETSTVTVTATSGSIQQTITITLTVN